MHEVDDEAQCQRQLAKASEQAALAESEKEYDSTHEAEQRAGQMKQAYKDDYAAWHAVARVTEQLWAKFAEQDASSEATAEKQTCARSCLRMGADHQHPTAKACDNLASEQSPYVPRVLEANG